MLTIFQIVIFWILFDFIYIFYRVFLLIIHKKRLSVYKHSSVSVLIPAYNEELCIEKTLTSCIYQTYPNLEIIVINDGSTDKTSEVVNFFRKNHEDYIKDRNIDFKIIDQNNQGKSSALNNGKENSRGDFLVTIDADSFLNSHAIEKIMSYFNSEDIGAVAGNIIAISNHSLLGYLQKMEYELGIYFIRNSQSSLGNVLVTPGALSAYKKSAVRKFEEGTLTEDFDSSIRILEKGYKIIMAPNALCYTQVPLSISDLIKQRVRWQQGSLEVFCKHYFHKKSFIISLEWILQLMFGFYALFNRILALFIIPLFLISNSYSSLLLFIFCFYFYSFFIYEIIFSIVVYYSRDRMAFLVVPLFIIYYNTIILYSVLAAQILSFKEKNQKWEKIKRYHI